MKIESRLKRLSTFLLMILMIMATVSTPSFAARPDRLNSLPVIAEGGSLTVMTSVDEPVTLTLNAMDREKSTMTWYVLPGPSKGTAVLSEWTNIKGKSQVEVTYDPDEGASGDDAFAVMVKDVLEASASIVINVEIIGASTYHPPLAVNDSYITDEDTVLTIGATGVLANDSDEDGDPITAVKVAGPSNGTITLSSDGSFVYTPNADFAGTDSFTYKANDGLTDSNIATVTITVTKATLPTTALWDDIRSYQCTYASDQFLDSSLLSEYDAFILEPDAVSVQKLNEIKAQNPNAFIIGYISIGETSTLLKDSSGHPLDIYFLDKRGKPIQNPIWGSYYVDARKPLWHQMVLEQYLPAIYAKGYDGAFLDTVDTSANIQFEDSASGMSSLIKEIKSKFSDKKIVINRGFHLLLGDSNDVSGSIDGVMFESYSSTWYPEYHIYPEGESDYNWTESITNQLNSIRWQYNEDGSVKRVDGMPVKSSTYFNVFAHDYATSSQISVIQYCVDRAYSKAFVPSLGSMNLSEEPYDWQSLVVMPSESDWGSAIN